MLTAGVPWREYLRRWDNADRALVTAVLLEETLICQRCGTSDWQWDAVDAFQAVVHVCKGCAPLDLTNEDLNKPDAPKLPGRSVRLVPRAFAAAMMATTTERRRPKSPRELARERQEGSS